MTSMIEKPHSRRDFLKGSGALIVAFTVPLGAGATRARAATAAFTGRQEPVALSPSAFLPSSRSRMARSFSEGLRCMYRMVAGADAGCGFA